MSENTLLLIILVTAVASVLLLAARSILSTYHEYGWVAAANYLLWLVTALLSVLLFAMPPVRARANAFRLGGAAKQ